MSAVAITTDEISRKLDELPTLPSIVYELNEVINDPMSSTKDVEKIMANDVSMTTKVLKLANSAYYAIPGGVSSLSRAIAYIGFDTIQQLVLSASILQALETKGPTEFDMNEFWKHSIGVGIAGETIAKHLNHPLPADIFTCGLVHDMGKIALFVCDEDAMMTISKYAIENKMSFAEAEIALEAPKHTFVGKMLAEKWELPNQLKSSIALHHEKEPSKRGPISAELNQTIDIIYLANLLIHALKFGNSGHQKVLGAPKDVMGRLMINMDKDFKLLIKSIKDNLDKASDFIKIIGGGS